MGITYTYITCINRNKGQIFVELKDTKIMRANVSVLPIFLGTIIQPGITVVCQHADN